MDIYYERQNGGLCRLHAINTFFQRQFLTVEAFHKHIKEYDAYLLRRFNIKTSSAQFDLVNSDQTNLVSFVLKKNGVHCRYYSLNSFYKKPTPDIANAEFVFVYNQGHIWSVIKKNGKHYKVDNGVSKFNIHSLFSMKNIGAILPVSLKQEWEVNVDKILGTLGAINTRKELQELLIDYNHKKKILGDLEIPLGVAVSILETKLKNQSKYKKIAALVNTYNEFVSKFTDGNYNDIQLVLAYVPDILISLVRLRDTRRFVK